MLQVIYTDVALDPYSSDGHDGIVREDGKYLLFTLLNTDDGFICLCLAPFSWQNVD
jgi:hypothetical protein